MNDEVQRLVVRYARKGILIDTNILLLYFVGSFDQDLISSFKRTLQFTVEDYNTLLLLLQMFDRLVTTPNILTEVSNFSGQLGEPAKTSYFYTFAKQLALMEEHYVASREVAAEDEFIKMGLTDASIFKLPKDQYLVLTDDFRLSQSLQHKGIDVINFNHIRPLGWI
jgi:rRNA-processing protein FCF1